jgi:hypothetical protein
MNTLFPKYFQQTLHCFLPTRPGIFGHHSPAYTPPVRLQQRPVLFLVRTQIRKTGNAFRHGFTPFTFPLLSLLPSLRLVHCHLCGHFNLFSFHTTRSFRTTRVVLITSRWDLFLVPT